LGREPSEAVEQSGETSLVEAIVDLGLARRDRVEAVAGSVHGAEQELAEALLAAGVVDEYELHRALAELHDMRFARADDLVARVDPSLARRFSQSYLEGTEVLPIGVEGGRLIVATGAVQADFDELLATVGVADVRAYLLAPTDLERVRARLGVDVALGEAGAEPGVAASIPRAPASEDMGEVLGRLLLDAVGERATDIHLERYEDEVRVRLRVDGDLHDFTGHALNAARMQGVINVLKVDSGMEMTEHMRPQDGRMRRQIAGRTYDLRVHVQPAFFAEHAVIRLLPQQKSQLSIEELGFPPTVARRYRRLLQSPGGLILVVGPTGSGKTTTLYAGLEALAADATRKVISVEDPVEYAMRGIEQTQVNEEAGFGFADAMRAFVREDPDVILVGEIRDEETALEAVRASQTGHLVLSTLHANDTVDAVQRLLDLGLSPNSVASELVAVFAQRLAKRNCSACRQETTPDERLVDELFPDGRLPQDFAVFGGEGCRVCNDRGTRGRIAAVEFLPTGVEMRQAVADRLHVDQLRAVALESGLVTMRSSALRLVFEGEIPMKQLSRLLPVERMAPERLPDG
jgi:type IV pilus assembly protein PilB